MYDHEIGKVFSEITAPLEEDRLKRQREAFVPESRPIPEGLLGGRVPLGHIAFMGDFIAKTPTKAPEVKKTQ